jgi:hypothetical protein
MLLPIIFKYLKSRKIRIEMKKILGSPSHIQKDNIKIDNSEI